MLGLIRQRLINQEGLKNTEITLKKLKQDYSKLLETRSLNELGTSFRYNQSMLE